MDIKLTPEQKNAVFSNGNILVAAAAGSGKTAVLVERVIRMLTAKESNISADKLLIVTFTNAAAAEMRSRIEQRLDEEIQNNPTSANLRSQKHLLKSAKICTIDSFCIDLVRENFEKLDIEPDFKISDAATLKEIDQKVLKDIFERYLAQNNPVFLKLLDILSCEYSQQNFYKIVFNIYDYSRQLPSTKDWFSYIASNYKSFDKDNIYYNYVFSEAIKQTNLQITALKKAVDMLAVNEAAFEKFSPIFFDAIAKLEELKVAFDSLDWDNAYSLLSALSFMKKPVVRGLGDIYEVTAAKSVYDDTVKLKDELLKLMPLDYSAVCNQLLSLYEPISLLCKILCEFEDELFKAYRENNTFTFHNTEQMALSLLCYEENGEIKETENGKQLLSRFDEILVDEYQDTNDLQNSLFYVLSNRGEKLFAVGDVKQSIYAFRGANPKNFQEKKKNAVLYDESNENVPQKIILGNNFRCKPAVCDFINYFFKLFLNEETGDIIYDNEEELKASAEFPKSDTLPCEIQIIDTDSVACDSTELEALQIADYIKKTINSGEIIKADKESLRCAKYSDFAILLRSAKSNAPVIARVLKECGIPVSYVSEEFAETTEISTFLALLKVIDNPKSDIELLTVMMSPIFNFSAEELAEIRVGKRYQDLFSSVITAANEGNERFKSFLKKLELYRIRATVNSLPRFISYLLLESGYLDIALAMPGGEKRKNNLLLLSYYAESFVSENNGISSFVRFIKNNSSRISGAGEVSGSNSVKIMSIHASKGLQFPICIIACAGKSFIDMEASETALYSAKYGVGFKYFDEQLKQPVEAVSRRIILDNIRNEKYAEELRLLYVALTRTQDKLVILGAVDNLEKKCNNLQTVLTAAESKINLYSLKKAKSYLDWVLEALILHSKSNGLRTTAHSLILNDFNCEYSINVIDGLRLLENTVMINAEESLCDNQLLEKISSNLSYTYPFEPLNEVVAKTSVSRLANSAEDDRYAFKAKPSFMLHGKLSSAAKGTAMHKVMEFFDFEAADNIEAELDRLYEWQYISVEERDSLNIDALKAFFKSDIFARIKKSQNVRREMRFITEIAASTVYPDLGEICKDENIIVQGAVDLCFVENGELVILDFKTDRVEDIKQIRDTYAEQLNIYAIACQKIFSLPVKEKIIYSFDKASQVNI